MAKSRCYSSKWTQQFFDWDSIPLLMTIEESAQLLRVSQETVRNMVKENKIKGKLIGTAYRIEKSSIRELFEL